MKSLSQMSIEELEREKKFVESKLTTNDLAEGYLSYINKEIKRRT